MPFRFSKIFSVTVLISLAWILASVASAQSTGSTGNAGANPPASAPAASGDPAASGTSAAQTPKQRSPSGTESQEPIPADQAGPPEAGADDTSTMFVFKKEVEEVMLHATVTDAQRNLVPNLDRSVFTIIENGVPQPITSFRRQDVPVAMGIVVDNSGSMREKRDEVNKAVVNLIRASNPQDEIFVVNFSQNYYLDQDFTSDVHLLETALHQVSSIGSTALYDAIVASAVHLRNNPRLDKKVLIVITDGEDNMSQETLDEALSRLQLKNGPTIYAIGLLGGGMQRRGRDALQRLAQDTGGVAYFPENLSEVGSITSTVAHDIRTQYLIAYRPKNQNAKPDNGTVRVEAHAPGYSKLNVQTRSAYAYGGGSSQPSQR